MAGSMGDIALSIEMAFRAYDARDRGRCGCGFAIDCSRSREEVEFSPSEGIGDARFPLLGGGHSSSVSSVPDSSSIPLGDGTDNMGRNCSFELAYALRNGPSTRCGASLPRVRGGGLA